MDYIKWIRNKVGHESIILNFSGACITNANGEILLQKRNRDKDIWGFPGGAIEIGESALEAMKREVKEETGLEVEINYFIGAYTKYFAEYPNGDKAQTICFFFKCAVIGGELMVDNNETFELRFVDVKNLPTLFNKQHQEMLQDYLDGKTNVCK